MEELADFILQNHYIVMSYHCRYYTRLTCLANTPYEIIRQVWLNALKSSGYIPPLDDMHQCMLNFLNKIELLHGVERNNLTFVNFANCFIPNFAGPEQLDELRKQIISNPEFIQMGPKKVNLFLRDIIMFGSGSIFADNGLADYESRLKVPVDKVIRKVCDKLYPNENFHNAERVELAQNMFQDCPILLEDFWFWGHFTFRNKEFVPINEAMLYSDDIIDGDFILDYNLRQNIREFYRIVNNGIQ